MGRRPRIYLAVILPSLALGVIVAYLVVGMYAASHDVPIYAVPDLNGILIAVPTLILWIPVALLLANVVIRAVPPLRRVADSYVTSLERPDFGTSQRQLIKVLLWSAFVCVPLVVVGWSI
jgi:hypothetical protein